MSVYVGRPSDAHMISVGISRELTQGIELDTLYSIPTFTK